MKELLELNKGFLIKGYLWISGIMTSGFSIFLFFFFSEVPTKWILIIYSITLIFAPLFVLSAWISDWFRKRRYKNQILIKNPYSELEKIGFTKKAIKTNHNSLVDYIKFAEINECQVTFDIDLRKPKIAEFTIYGLTEHLNSKNYLRKVKEYEYSNIDFSHYYFTKRIDIRKQKLNSIQELEKIILEFTHIVKKEKYIPIPITEIKPVGNNV